MTIYCQHALCEKCPNTELFLVRIFLYLDWICPNTGKYSPEITPYLDTFHAVTMSSNLNKDGLQLNNYGPWNYLKILYRGFGHFDVLRVPIENSNIRITFPAKIHQTQCVLLILIMTMIKTQQGFFLSICV